MQIQLNNRTILICTVLALGGYAFVRGGGTVDGVRGLVGRGSETPDPTPPFAAGVGPLQPAVAQPSGDLHARNEPAVASGARSYTDPDGRFSLRVPDGWQTAPQNGGVVVSRDAATVVVSPFGDAASGEQVVSVLARQYGQQWRGLQLVDRGQYVLGGEPSTYAMFQGTDPRGRRMLLRLVGAVGPNGALALILSVPAQEFNALGPTLQSIETSVAWR